MKSITAVETLEHGDAITVTWQDGSRSRYHAIWLRDNALDADTRSVANGQKLIRLADIPSNTRISAASLASDGSVRISFSPEEKTLSYPASFLAGHDYDRSPRRGKAWTGEHIETWDATLGDGIPRASFTDIQEDSRQLIGWLAGVRRYGVARLLHGPLDSGALCRIVDRFGHIRQTNYGRWFEVRSQINPSNLAYTGLGLQAHTDNPYRDPVPTLQILYCLENSTDGGDSVVVDGFGAALRLRDESPDMFDLLSRYRARFEYAGSAGIRLRACRPVIELAPDGELIAIRFNNRSMAPLVDVSYDDMPHYYRALRRFGEIIDAPEMAVTLRLAPGECFMVDNTRVLHARTAFTTTGSRWLQGCYADKDGLLSTLEAYEQSSASDPVAQVT